MTLSLVKKMNKGPK